jgi:hypothetical protein
MEAGSFWSTVLYFLKLVMTESRRMLVVLLKNMHDIHQSYIAWYILSNQLVIYHLDNNDVGRNTSVGIEIR